MTLTILLLSFVLITFLIIRIVRKQRNQLKTSELVVAFTLKVIFAWVYGYLFLNLYNGDDTWDFFKKSIYEKKMLLTDPAFFFMECTPFPALELNLPLPDTLRLYLAQLEYAIMVKLPAFFNLLSGDNYYINCIFFSFLTFWGHYWLFILLNKIFPAKRFLLLLVIFFFPPALFWLSGYRADGLIFSCISLLFLSTYNVLYESRKKYILYGVLALAGILILRFQLVMLAIPAIGAWWLSYRTKIASWKVFITVYCMLSVLFLASSLMSPLNLISIVAKKQQEFFALHGNTRFDLDTLNPSPESFLKILPQAINNSFLRPYLWEAKGSLQFLAAVENLLLIILFCLAIVNWRKAGFELRNPGLLAFTCFALSVYLFTGYTVPFPGAIIRYRIIAELLLLIVMVVITPFKLKRFGNINPDISTKS